MAFQRGFLVQFPKEFRIGQPRRQHFFIARNHRRAAILRIYIGGANKGGGKRALLPTTR